MPLTRRNNVRPTNLPLQAWKSGSIQQNVNDAAKSVTGTTHIIIVSRTFSFCNVSQKLAGAWRKFVPASYAMTINSRE
jgi:hypothetical protein